MSNDFELVKAQGVLESDLNKIEVQLSEVLKQLKILESRVDGIHKSAINQHTDLYKLSNLIKSFGSNISRNFYND